MSDNNPVTDDNSNPIPLVERWAQDDMKGTIIYDSVEDLENNRNPHVVGEENMEENLVDEEEDESKVRSVPDTKSVPNVKRVKHGSFIPKEEG